MHSLNLYLTPSCVVEKFFLNIFIVEKFVLDKSLAYVFVIITQILLGYVFNKFLVFESVDKNSSKLFFKYLAMLIIFRGADLVIYSIMVKVLSIPYLIAQFVNGIFIIGVKFFSYKSIFENPKVLNDG